MLRRRITANHLLGTTVLSASALLANVVSADVTAADVWASYTAYYESTGAQVIGTVGTDGADTVITDQALLYRFPFGVATMRVGMPDMRMTEQSDGTVTFDMPDAFDLLVEVDVPDEASGSITLTIAQENFEGVASGTPGDVTFVQSADTVTLGLKDITIPDAEIDMNMQAVMDGYTATSRVVEGDMIITTSDVTNGATDVAYFITLPEGEGEMTNTGQIGASEATFETAFPTGGFDVMNLSDAVAAGAYVRGTSIGTGSTSETITTSDGVVISEQTQSSSSGTGRVSIDANGFDLFGEGTDINFALNMPEAFPFPVAGNFAAIVVGYKFPLMPSPDAQDVAFRLDMRDIELSESLWGMFDPAEELPRDPATINIDIAGTVISDIDALNFATLEAQMEQPNPPISVETLTINEISVAAIGASALATGAFTLDSTDTTTFDGFPRPVGSAILNVTGANGLIDRLVAFGIIGPEEAGMARLGMGLIASSTGDDAFETRLDVNEEGHVIVNGQRMR